MSPTAPAVPIRRWSVWRGFETIAWTAGVLLLVTTGGLYLAGAVSARRAVAEFESLARQASGTSTRPDQTLWSPNRILAWKASMKRDAPAALAILRIARIGLEVPVLEGTDDWTLNRAVGHIDGTAAPGSAGNVGIAGHRDGFFRGLKDIAAGDVLELQLQSRTERYSVERAWVVEPEDVSVLDPTPSPSVTLVTCYPFYFVGSAPQRFIVRAVAPRLSGS